MDSPNAENKLTFTALVVDDNYFNRDIFRMALEFAGYQVEQADSGESGLEKLNNKHFNLLILDLQMPMMDGIAVLNRLPKQTQTNGEKTWVVVVTANAHMATDDVGEMADYVMYKPINVAEFSNFATRLKQMFVSPTV